MVIYKLKVALFYEKKIYREIDIAGKQTLEDLHDIIFDAFDRYDPHMYSFYFPGKAVKNTRALRDAPEYSLPDDFDDNPFSSRRRAQDVTRTKIAFLGLTPKDKFYYLFDFGDEWWHEITVLDIFEAAERSRYPKLVKKVGDSPQQYEFEDEDEYENGEDEEDYEEDF